MLFHNALRSQSEQKASGRPRKSVGSKRFREGTGGKKKKIMKMMISSDESKGNDQISKTSKKPNDQEKEKNVIMMNLKMLHLVKRKNRHKFVIN